MIHSFIHSYIEQCLVSVSTLDSGWLLQLNWNLCSTTMNARCYEVPENIIIIFIMCQVCCRHRDHVLSILCVISSPWWAHCWYILFSLFRLYILCVIFLCFWYHKSFHSIFAFLVHQLCSYAPKIILVLYWWFWVGIFCIRLFPLLLLLTSFQCIFSLFFWCTTFLLLQVFFLDLFLVSSKHIHVKGYVGFQSVDFSVNSINTFLLVMMDFILVNVSLDKAISLEESKNIRKDIILQKVMLYMVHLTGEKELWSIINWLFHFECLMIF